MEHTILLEGTVQNKLEHFHDTLFKYLKNSTYVEHTMLHVGTVQNKLEHFLDAFFKISWEH